MERNSPPRRREQVSTACCSGRVSSVDNTRKLQQAVLTCFIIAVALVLVSPATLSQNASSKQTPSGAELLLMKLAPGKWAHDVEGDVRSIETVEYRLEKKGGQMVETRTGSTKVSYFDRRGFETESVQDGEDKIEWKYDAEGRLTEMIMTMGGAPFSRELYRYDLERRRVTAETYLFGSDKLHMREVSIFDERWNETRKETERFGDGVNQQPGKEIVVYNLAYDSKGRVIASSIADERGHVSYKFEEEFDDSNRLIKSISYQYDEGSGALLTKSVNTYEKSGLLETYTEYDSRGRLLRRETRTRERDARGNWITERQTVWDYDKGSNTEPYTFIKRRKITYY